MGTCLCLIGWTLESCPIDLALTSLTVEQQYIRQKKNSQPKITQTVDICQSGAIIDIETPMSMGAIQCCAFAYDQFVLRRFSVIMVMASVFGHGCASWCTKNLFEKSEQRI